MVVPNEKLDPPGVPGTPTNPGGGNGNPVSTCDPDSVYFQSQILPLLVSNCAKSGCHTVEDHQEGVILNNYSNVMNTGDIDPGRADHSDLYEVLTESDPDKRMPPPPAAPLTSAQIGLIGQWINQGANNNSCSNGCDTTNVTFSGNVFPIIQNNCTGCHSGATPSGLIDLTSHMNIKVMADNGRLLGSINHDAGFVPMPRGGNKLQACQIDQVRIWIGGGALNN